MRDDDRLLEHLRSLELIPAGVQRGAVPSEQEDLLPWIAQQWDGAVDAGYRSPRGRRAERMARWALRSRRIGMRLTRMPVHDCWTPLAGRLAWQPGATAARRADFSVASSHLGRSLAAKRALFAALRKICRHETGRLWLTVEQTSMDRFVDRAAERFANRVRRLSIERPGSGGWDRWVRAVLNARWEESTRNDSLMLVSPVLPGSERDVSPTPLPDFGRDDGLLCARRVYVPYLRRGGKVHRLLRRVLSAREPHDPRILLAVGPDLVPPRTARPLLEAGAEQWTTQFQLALEPPATARLSFRPAHRHRPETCDVGPTRAAPDVSLDEPWDYLTHCTRARHGPWPGQDEGEFIDELLSADPIAGVSPLDALLRILGQDRLLATPRNARSGRKVVCFSAAPLSEIIGLRRFRVHRVRWEFEPYGICIRRRWLVERGARPVVYGDEESFESLSIEDRPFFQLRRSRPDRRGERADWSVEREWRHVGDLPLDELGDDDAFLFVPTREEADSLRRAHRLPVVALRDRLAAELDRHGI